MPCTLRFFGLCTRRWYRCFCYVHVRLYNIEPRVPKQSRHTGLPRGSPACPLSLRQRRGSSGRGLYHALETGTMMYHDADRNNDERARLVHSV